jgi:hypothetical protein
MSKWKIQYEYWTCNAYYVVYRRRLFVFWAYQACFNTKEEAQSFVVRAKVVNYL